MKRTSAMHTDHNIKSSLSIGLSALVLGVVLLASCSKDEVTPEAAKSPSEKAGSPSNVVAEAGGSTVQPKNAPVTRVEPSDPKIEAYLCNPADSQCRVTGDPFAANSKEEAAWLATHGYPTKARYERLTAMSLAQLQAEAAKGDRSAAVLYAQKTALVPQGFYDGVGMLHDEAVSGNLFAYYGLSDVYWNSAEHRDLVASAAYLRLAYLLGDWKVTNKIGQLGLSPLELAVADERAASLRKTFSGGIDPSPRPTE